MSTVADFIRRKRRPLLGLAGVLAGGAIVVTVGQDSFLFLVLGLGIMMLALKWAGGGGASASSRPSSGSPAPSAPMATRVASITGVTLAFVLMVVVGVMVFSDVEEPYVSIVMWGGFALVFAAILGVSLYMQRRKRP